MASSQTNSKDSSSAKYKGDKGSKEGRVYEKLSLALLAKNGYELSKKENSKFRDFSIGREVGLGKDGKFDDTVFRYTANDNTKNFIFIQIKHKQDDHRIDSKALSAEASRAKGGRDGGMSRDFNLQKYFISYLSVREELQSVKSEEFRNGKIKYVAIFTNAALDTEELISKRFSLKAAPDDIINLFSLKKTSLKTQEPKHCYQFCNISEDLRKILQQSSDLHRVARELAQYVVWENHRENKIMGIDTPPIKHYHVALQKEVIEKSQLVKNKSTEKKTKNETYCEAQFRDEKSSRRKVIENSQLVKNKSTEKKTKNETYCEAQFRDDFLENEKTGPKQLRDAVFEVIREIDESKKSFSDEELKNFLKGIKWKIVPNFGKTKTNKETSFPLEWKTVKVGDITDFLKCLVFIVNRPRVGDLQALFLRSVQDTVMDRHYGALLREIVDKLENTGPELRERIEKDLGIYETTNFEEKWTSGDKIVKFFNEQKQQISVSFFVTAMTLIYENEVMQFGKFKESDKIEECLDIFFSNSAKVLRVNTPLTLLSSIKILQYLNSERGHLAEDGRIYINLDGLKSKEKRESVASAFELKRNILLVIEYRHTVNEQDVEEFYNTLYNVVNANPNKKIILIMPQDERNNLLEKFRQDFQNKGNIMLEYDFIDKKDFFPREDPFKKEVIMFQGQQKRENLSNITGIKGWNSYVHNLSQETNEQSIIDPMTLVKILNNDEIEVGSKPSGTSSLEGAYAKMFEEINVKTLAKKIRLQEHDNDTNDIYIISGIPGSSKQDKTNKLIQYLGLDNENEEFKNGLEDIVSFNKLQIVNDQFKEGKFQELCRNYPDKRIFWICVKWENNVRKFKLQEIYNPKFYLRRKFKNIIIEKTLKEYLITRDISEIFMFHCVEDKQELYKSMELDEHEIEQFEDNCKIFSLKSDAEAKFKELSKQNQTVHLLKFENNEFVWWDSHGSVETLQKYIDYERQETSLVEEDKLIKNIKDRNVVILADDPGMGKSTTLIKLYEGESEPSSIKNTHWVILIKLRDNLKAVRDLEFIKDSINIVSVVEFLSQIDSKLDNKLAKKLLAMALDKSKYFSKSVLLAFDGYDEVLDEDDRNLILLLIKFIKNETKGKLWITTRLHFKASLEKELSTIGIEFAPMDGPQKEEYITEYLKQRLYLILNDKLFNRIFANCNERQDIKSIRIYTDAFLSKMKLTFKGNISRFIGTPLQLSLMLEGSVRHFKNWVESGDGKIPVFNYVGNDAWEIYENFINMKYDIYFQKVGILESVLQRREKLRIDQDHKDFAESKIFEINPNNNFEEFKDVFLLVGVIKSQGSDLEFIHKTFEEFFAAKVFTDWIKKVEKTNKQEYLLKVILMKPDYRLVRTFMNLQLQKMTVQARKNELDKSHKHYGKTAAKLLTEEKSPLIDENGTPLHIAVEEGNNDIACFLLKSLRHSKEFSDVLRKFLLTPGKMQRTALHLACKGGDVKIVKELLDAAEGISDDTLQEFLKCLNATESSALDVAVLYRCTHDTIYNREIFEELLTRANSKLDLILTPTSSLCKACISGKEIFVEFLLQKFENDKLSLQQLLLFNGELGNTLVCARTTTTVQKLISAAKSMDDDNETLKNLLLPEEGYLPFNYLVSAAENDVVEMVLNVAKDLDDDNYTLKQLLLNEGCGESALHVAAATGDVDVIKLLLETAADLGSELLEKLISAVDEEGKNAIELMFEHGHKTIVADSFKILEEDKYQSIKKKVMEMYDNVPLESRLYFHKEKLITAIERDDIKEVKDILSKVINSCVFSNESLKKLLLDEDIGRKSALYIACERGISEIIKELLFYAMNIDDGGETLNDLLPDPFDLEKTHFQVLRHGYTSEIKQIVDSLICEARNNNNEHAVNIFEEINKRYAEVQPPSEN